MLELLRLESKLVLARYSSQIAMKMVSLTMEEDNEIARQACMDVINHPDFKAANDAKIGHEMDKEEEPPEVPPELASKWLEEWRIIKIRLKSRRKGISYLGRSS